MNHDIIDGKWKEIKGEIRNIWSDITGDELEKVKGNLTSISGLIQQKYGHQKEDVTEKLNVIMSKFGQTAEQIKKDISDSSKPIKSN